MPKFNKIARAMTATSLLTTGALATFGLQDTPAEAASNGQQICITGQSSAAWIGGPDASGNFQWDYITSPRSRCTSKHYGPGLAYIFFQDGAEDVCVLPQVSTYNTQPYYCST